MLHGGYVFKPDCVLSKKATYKNMIDGYEC